MSSAKFVSKLVNVNFNKTSGVSTFKSSKISNSFKLAIMSTKNQLPSPRFWNNQNLNNSRRLFNNLCNQRWHQKRCFSRFSESGRKSKESISVVDPVCYLTIVVMFTYSAVFNVLSAKGRMNCKV